jgi:hypothetical protein
VIVFPGALGDLILALPALRALVGRASGGRIVVVAEPLRALAAIALPTARIESLDAAEALRLFADGPPPIWLAPDAELHAWIGSHDAAVRARLAQLAAIVHCRPVVRGTGRQHAAAVYGRQVGIPLAWRALVTAARLTPPASVAAATLLAELRPPVLALSIGAGATGKRWSRAAFTRVVEGWCTTGGDVVEIAGPAEHDVPPLDGARRVEWALPDVAALLAGADVWLGNDCGPSHLAATVGLPGRVLFGPTQPHRWRPLSFRLRPLRARPARQGRASVDTLSPTRVLGALQSLTTPTPGSSVRGRRAPRDGAASAPE